MLNWEPKVSVPINVATEDVKKGVDDNEFRSPYANIFDIDPSD